MTSDERGVAYPFWERLEQARTSNEWTWDELAERSGVARSTINNLATGDRGPQARTVHALADAIGLDRDEAKWLAGFPGAKPPAGQPTDVRAAIAADPYLDDATKTALLHMVDVADRANGYRRGRTPGANQGRTGDNRQAG